MEVVMVRAENFKGLQLVEIHPNKTTTIIGGLNRQGKSSLLDAISAALGGTKLCPKKPIRDGESSAKVSVELTGEPAKMIPAVTVIREFTRKEDGTIKSTLNIVTKEGCKAPTPQTLLNDVMGKLGFDPEGFLRMKPAEQAEVLRELVGLDFSTLDAQYQKIYDDRTIIGREGKSLRSQLEACTHHADAPADLISVSELTLQLKSAHAHNKENDGKRANARSLQESATSAGRAVDSVSSQISDLKNRLADAEQELEKAKATHEQRLRVAREADNELATLEDQSTIDIESQITNAEDTNNKVRANQKRNELESAVSAKTEEWKKATGELEQIDATKQQMRESANWPVSGLGYDQDGVTLEGRPFDQASSYEQRKAAMSICVAMSPTLRFAFLKDGSLLDDAGLIEFAQLAAEKGIQLFIERVGKGQECNIIIENGAVESVSE